MKRKKTYFLIIHLAIILLISVSSVISFLTKESTANNEFILGTVTPKIKETFDGTSKVKEDVYVKNDGNVDVYVRVGIVFSFEDQQNNILIDTPVENVDYTIDFSNSTNWVLKSDGYYYYKTKLSAGATTDILINECAQIKDYNDRYFNVEILVQSIQAIPQSAITDAWGVTLQNGLIQ